jgi:hypothetical protein
MDLDGKRQQRTLTALSKLAERDLGNGILATPIPRVRKTGK